MMRTDESGHPCPATLGEYRALCVQLAGEACRAVRWLDAKIAVQGRDSDVVADDAQMRVLLYPMMVRGLVPVPFASQEVTYRYEDGGEAIRCLRCNRVSSLWHDVQHGYCGACHLFHDDVGIHEALDDGRLMQWLQERQGETP